MSHETVAMLRHGGERSKFTEAAERFILLLGEKKKERVWERKGLAIGVERRLADDGKRCSGGGRCI